MAINPDDPALSTCLDCGDRIPDGETRCYVPVSIDEQFWLSKGPVEGPLCAGCVRARDNAEPGDPDGEDLFRDRAAEQRDALEQARRLK